MTGLSVHIDRRNTYITKYNLDREIIAPDERVLRFSYINSKLVYSGSGRIFDPDMIRVSGLARTLAERIFDIPGVEKNVPICGGVSLDHRSIRVEREELSDSSQIETAILAILAELFKANVTDLVVTTSDPPMRTPRLEDPNLDFPEFDTLGFEDDFEYGYDM
jgi:hypothetical protein